MIYEQWRVAQDLVNRIPKPDAKFWYVKQELHPRQLLEIEEERAKVLNNDAFHSGFYYLQPGEFVDGNIFVS